jgi:hypothetical protein
MVYGPVFGAMYYAGLRYKINWLEIEKIKDYK